MFTASCVGEHYCCLMRECSFDSYLVESQTNISISFAGIGLSQICQRNISICVYLCDLHHFCFYRTMQEAMFGEIYN